MTQKITVPVNNTFLDLTVNIGLNLLAARSVFVKTKSPLGAVSSHEVEITDATNGKVLFKIPKGFLNVTGEWKVWSFVVQSDGRNSIGNPFILNVIPEGVEII